MLVLLLLHMGSKELLLLLQCGLGMLISQLLLLLLQVRKLPGLECMLSCQQVQLVL
jgi:hypothetical protein